MRSLLLTLMLVALCPAVLSQQASTDTPTADKSKSQKKERKEPPTPEPAVQPQPTPPAPPPKPEPAKDADKDKDKEEHYDMTEVPPVVTHHQITLDGKVLKYTATAGRLPIKRGDGQIQAE